MPAEAQHILHMLLDTCDRTPDHVKLLDTAATQLLHVELAEH